MSQTEVQLIKDAVIVNADVSNSAAIDVSKISGVMPLAGGTFTDDVTFTGNSANVQFDKSDSAFEFLDNAKAKFGTGDDLQIYHDGTNSIMTNQTGQFKINGDDIHFMNAADTETMLEMGANGNVVLYFDNSAKLATNSGGVAVTGTLTATTFSGSGASLTSLPAANVTGQLTPSTGGAGITIDFDSLPTSDPGVKGRLYRGAISGDTYLKISAG